MSAEAKLVNAGKMSELGEMAGGIAHEINMPLGTLALILSQIQEQMTEIAGLTVRRIAKIIQGLRTFSRNGSADPFESATLKQLLESTLRLCQEKFKNHQVKLSLDPFPDTVRISCRPVQISQVLLNLLNNACDAIQKFPEKWIKVHVETKDNQVWVSVVDSGNGVSDAILDKIFQPFFTTKAVGKGTGLGLSISKGIMDSHGGSVHFELREGHPAMVLIFPEVVRNEFKDFE